MSWVQKKKEKKRNRVDCWCSEKKKKKKHIGGKNAVLITRYKIT